MVKCLVPDLVIASRRGRHDPVWQLWRRLPHELFESANDIGTRGRMVVSDMQEHHQGDASMSNLCQGYQFEELFWMCASVSHDLCSKSGIHIDWFMETKGAISRVCYRNQQHENQANDFTTFSRVAWMHSRGQMRGVSQGSPQMVSKYQSCTYANHSFHRCQIQFEHDDPDNMNDKNCDPSGEEEQGEDSWDREDQRESHRSSQRHASGNYTPNGQDKGPFFREDPREGHQRGQRSDGSQDASAEKTTRDTSNDEGSEWSNQGDTRDDEQDQGQNDEDWGSTMDIRKLHV